MYGVEIGLINACTTRVVRQGRGIESARYVIVMS
jgi:hypothetical protein